MELILGIRLHRLREPFQLLIIYTLASNASLLTPCGQTVCTQNCNSEFEDIKCTAGVACTQTSLSTCRKLECTAQICTQQCRGRCDTIHCQSSKQCIQNCGENCTMLCQSKDVCSSSCTGDGCSIACAARNCHVVCSNCNVNFASNQTIGQVLCLHGGCKVQCMRGALCTLRCPPNTCNLTYYNPPKTSSVYNKGCVLECSWFSLLSMLAWFYFSLLLGTSN